MDPIIVVRNVGNSRSGAKFSRQKFRQLGAAPILGRKKSSNPRPEKFFVVGKRGSTRPDENPATENGSNPDKPYRLRKKSPQPAGYASPDGKKLVRNRA